jgi:hypothetical protein
MLKSEKIYITVHWTYDITYILKSIKMNDKKPKMSTITDKFDISDYLVK